MQIKVILVTPDTVTADGKGIQNTESVDTVMLALDSPRCNHRTDRNRAICGSDHHRSEDATKQNNDMSDAKYRKNGDKIEGNGAHVSTKFPVQPIARHVGTGLGKEQNMLFDGTGTEQKGHDRLAKSYPLTFWFEVIKQLSRQKSQDRWKQSRGTIKYSYTTSEILKPVRKREVHEE